MSGPSFQLERGANKLDSFSYNWLYSSRQKRLLEKVAADPLQTRITDYWNLSDIDNVQRLVSENRRLSMLLQQFSTVENSELVPENSFGTILKQLFLSAEKNRECCPTHRRHPSILKKFATIVYILAGPMAYELIQQNMPQALPSIRTVQSAIHSEYKTISEGCFRFDELREHLNQYDAPLFVSIAEDATRIVGRVEYDSETNRCVGFVLPLDENGLPKGDSFLATSFSGIESMFLNNAVAKYAYVYMTQSLCTEVPPFCLACIGTNNKFDSMAIMQRWQYIVRECEKRGIAVLSFGGDGDSRIMKCMKVFSSFHISPSDPLLRHIPAMTMFNISFPSSKWADWFFATGNAICCVQDVVHVAVKLKSRLLKPQIVLPMGNFFASGNHLHTLRQSLQKDKHGLRLKDINHKDKQNFQAVINITNAGHLLSHVPQADGTKQYIEIIKCVIDGYLDKALEPLERIEKCWYASFMLRYWRKWIMLNNSYTLRNNFVTSNAFSGVELNAHAMVNFMRTIRDHAHDDNCFVPWLLGSQTCEETFRAARSMSSVFSTVINFGMLGLLRRLHRLHIQLVIQAEMKEEIVFPRVLKHAQKLGKNKCNKYRLADATDDNIYKAIKIAQGRAKATVEELGMADLFVRHLLWAPDKKIRGIDGGKEHANYDDNDNDSDDGSDGSDDDESGNCTGEDQLQSEQKSIAQLQESCLEEEAMIAKDLETISKHSLLERSTIDQLKVEREFYRQLPSETIPIYERVEMPKKSRKEHGNKFDPCVEVKGKNGESIYIRKTTAVWLFQEGERVSADCLFRVRHKQPFSINTAVTDTLQSGVPSFAAGNTSVVNGTSVGTTSVVTGTTSGALVDTKSVVADTSVGTPSVAIGTSVGTSSIVTGTSSVATGTSVGTPSVLTGTSRSSVATNFSISTLSVVTRTSSSAVVTSVATNSHSVVTSYSTSVGTLSVNAVTNTLTGHSAPCVVPGTSRPSVITGTSVGTHSVDTGTNPVIDLQDCSIEYGKDINLWVKIGSISLYHSDRCVILTPGRWLWGTHLTAVQLLLKQQFPDINGLIDTFKITHAQKGITLSSGSVQILHVNDNHWITISTLMSTGNDNDVIVYDSLNSPVSHGTKMQLANLIKTSKKSLKIKIANVNIQAGIDDCGVFAAAYSTALVNGQDPSTFVYDQGSMREHLELCLSRRNMEPFPSIRPRRSGKSRIYSIDVYCICRLPDDGSPMVCCDTCKEWFHQSCCPNKVNRKHKWYCTKCLSSHRNS